MYTISVEKKSNVNIKKTGTSEMFSVTIQCFLGEGVADNLQNRKGGGSVLLGYIAFVFLGKMLH